MHSSEVRTPEDARRVVEDRNLSHVKVGIFDIDGVLRGKYMSREKFFSALRNGFGFCDVVLGWDVQDQLYDNVRLTGWHTAYPDATVRILADSCRDLPFETGPNGTGMLLFLGEFAGDAGTVCPRGVLRRIAAKAQAMGFDVKAGAEYEFFVFEETPHSLRDKKFKGLKPITPGFFGYSVLRSSVWSEFYEDLLRTCETMRMPLEGLHTETGPGVIEAAIAADTVLEAADRAALFKTFTKVLAQRRGLTATFMAKWSEEFPGQSGHVHMSLSRADGTSAFYDPSDANGMSPVMRHFVAGQQALMPQLLAMVAPTINSYRRLIPGYWAPTHATWGVENRTCALRVIPGSTKSQRVEYRVAAADGNPYLVMAAALGAGLWGIEHQLEPSVPIVGNAYEVEQPADHALPTTLWDAAQRFKHSDAAVEIFGQDFVEHYAATREWEERMFRKHISDWELSRYFEII